MTRTYRLRARREAMERSREAILAAARGELARVGYGDLRIDAVARRAGVSRRTVYAHFPARALLAEAALRGRANALAERVARWSPRASEPASILDEIVAFHAREYREEHGLLETLLDGAPPQSGRRLLRELDLERLRSISRALSPLGVRGALRLRVADAVALVHATLSYPAWRVAITGPARRRAPRLVAAMLRSALL